MTHFTESQHLAIRKHATALAGRLGITRDKSFSPHQMEWKGLNAIQADVMRTARGLADKITDNLSEADSRSINDAHDVLMEVHDAIEQEKDIRGHLGDRGARADSRNPLSLAPIGADASTPAIADGGGYVESGVNENPSAPLLRSHQSMAAHVRDSGSDGLRGLGEAAFLRAMVTGARNDLERRALAEGSDSAGGYTVPSALAARMIDRLRAASVVFQAGAVAVPLSSDHNSIAKVATDPVPAWRAGGPARGGARAHPQLETLWHGRKYRSLRRY